MIALPLLFDVTQSLQKPNKQEGGPKLVFLFVLPDYDTQSFLIFEPKSSHKALDNGMRLTVSEVNTKNLGTTILLSSSEYCCKSSLQKAVCSFHFWSHLLCFAEFSPTCLAASVRHVAEGNLNRCQKYVEN